MRGDGDLVLYWMIANRRPGWNFALDRAIEHARRLGRPLVVLEPLRVAYRYASDRHHRWIIDGMRANAAAFADSPVRYLPYVEPAEGEGRGLLEALAARACVVVTDDWPGFFLPRMVAAAAARLPVRLEAVDSAGLLPFRDGDRVFLRAVDFRRHLQKTLAPHLSTFPAADPLADLDLPRLADLPQGLLERWPMADQRRLDGAVDDLPIDHGVGAVDERGGWKTGQARWRRFLDADLATYGEGRNHPDDDGSSRLSPWLHHGQVSVHQLFAELGGAERWAPDQLSERRRGQREGWWGMSAGAESFLDELVTWRELGLNMAARQDDADRYESLPDWARATLGQHADDPRPHRYTMSQFFDAATHDPVWNAAQRQLRDSGRMHNYLRMLWGKKILHWTASPQQALAVMLELNDRLALDGRDPNSLSGIFWVLGRYDRAWGPERPVFGKIRYMSSDSTRRKLRMSRYLERWGAPA